MNVKGEGGEFFEGVGQGGGGGERRGGIEDALASAAGIPARVTATNARHSCCIHSCCACGLSVFKCHCAAHRGCLCLCVACRQERAALAAGAASDGEASGLDGAAAAAVGSDEAELLRHEGLDLHHNMLEESRRVEEYEKLNRISGVGGGGLRG